MKSDTIVEMAKAIVDETKIGLSFQDIWEALSSVDCNKHTEKKGNLTYLSWAWAWGILMEHYPMATFKFGDNETHADGSMTVHCTVTIGECQRSMWLPVMDYKNAAIKSPNARDISDNKMRCLTKALAVFGLGHYIYAGEEIVNASSAEKITQKQLEIIQNLIEKTNSDVEGVCKKLKISSLADIPAEEFARVKANYEKKLSK
jgi:hypothetical protein